MNRLNLIGARMRTQCGGGMTCTKCRSWRWDASLTPQHWQNGRSFSPEPVNLAVADGFGFECCRSIVWAVKVYTGRLKSVSLPKVLPDRVWSHFIPAVDVGSCVSYCTHRATILLYVHLLED